MSDLPPDNETDIDEAGANDEALSLLLTRLRQEHRDLDTAIMTMERTAGPMGLLAVKRMKKRKLQLKDKIIELEDRLNPDIIA